MQDQQNVPPSQFFAPQTGADGIVPQQSHPIQPVDAPVPMQTQPPQGQSDPLTQATQAIDECLGRTMTSPNARMGEIAKIRAAYIKARFGMDITQ